MPGTPSDAEVLYGQDPDLYIRDGLGSIERAGQEQLAPAQRIAADQQHLRDLSARYGLTGDLATGVADALNESRGGGIDEHRVREWERDARAALTSDYGERAGQVLEDTQKLIASDAKLRKHLDATGLGSHPSVVRALARSAYEARKAGTLK